ncbi:MAG: hypothetical protein JWP01_3563 [Myxococcales bacterium]|nr:hypothetical protein [Myxococcales bacterium]
MLGVLGLFLPLVAVGRGPLRTELSARELTFGLDRAHRVIDRKVPGFLERRISPDVISARDDVRLVAHASRGAALAFIPAALLLVLGIAGMWRGRFGRGLAAFGLVCGIASIAAYVGLDYAIAYGIEEEPLLRHVALSLQFGATLLIIAGIGGVAGGVLGLIKPDLGGDPPHATPRSGTAHRVQ